MAMAIKKKCNLSILVVVHTEQLFQLTQVVQYGRTIKELRKRCLKSCIRVFPKCKFGRIPICFAKDQGRSQTSEHDEASFERQRREPLGGSGGMHPRKF